MLQLSTGIELREDGDARRKGRSVEHGQGGALGDPVSPSNRDRPEPHKEGCEHRAEKGVPLAEEAGDQYPQRDPRQHGVGERGDRECIPSQHHNGTEKAVGEANESRRSQRTLVEGAVEKFEEQVHAGMANVSAISPGVSTSSTGPKATCRVLRTRTSSKRIFAEIRS